MTLCFMQHTFSAMVQQKIHSVKLFNLNLHNTELYCLSVETSIKCDVEQPRLSLDGHILMPETQVSHLELLVYMYRVPKTRRTLLILTLIKQYIFLIDRPILNRPFHIFQKFHLPLHQFINNCLILRSHLHLSGHRLLY